MSNSFHTGFVCVACGARFAPGQTDGACPACGGNLDATYDYARIGREVDPRAIADATDRSIWRFAPFLPVDPARALAGAGDVIRQVGNSPLIRARRLEARLGARAIWLKDDGRLPSASFKDRASAMVVARAIEAGRNVIATASSGNAAAALARVASRAGKPELASAQLCKAVADRRAYVAVNALAGLGKLHATCPATTVAELLGASPDAAACACPRRPSTTTSRTRLPRSAARAVGEMSVRASESAGVTRILATSRATLPLPTITARWWWSGTRVSTWSGCALYQDATSVADMLPGRSEPGTSRGRSVPAPVA